MATSIFISYASPQRKWADWIYNELVSIGFDVEMDSESWRLGEGLVGKINDALLKHKIFLALWSNDYFSKDRWTFDEIKAAYSLYRQKILQIVPFWVEPEGTPPPLFADILSSSIFGLTENAARYEIRRRLEPYANRALRSLASPQKTSEFPGSMSILSNNPFSQALASKPDLIRKADEQARKDLSPQLVDSVNAYALEDIANQLRLLSRSYNSEPPSRVLENIIPLWADLDLAEKMAQNNPKKLRDVLVMKSRAYGLQSYATLDLGSSIVAFKNAVAMKSYAEKAGHAELTAWALGTQTLILSFDNQNKKALSLIEEGLRLPITGMARSRLNCRAALCWAEFGDLENTLSSINESEKTIDLGSSSSDEADGIFFFSRAKHHYYAGTALLEFTLDEARRSEKELRNSLRLFSAGDEDTKSISDELLATIYLANSIYQQERIDEILDTVQPVLRADREFRTSWHLRNLRSLGYGLLTNKRFKDSDVTISILDAIQDFEKDLNS